MSQKSASFLRYIHNFRGLAIVAIVIGHILQFLNWENTPRASYDLAVSIAINGTVYFVFIAGFLFQFLSKKYEYKSYLGKKFKNVILPYFLISIPGVTLCLLKNQPYYPAWFANIFVEWSFPQKVIALYLTGAHFFHLWFIPMIVIFYVISPVFIWIDRHPKAYMVLPFLLFLSLIVPRPEDDSLILQSFAHFLSVYLLGIFCCHYKEQVFFFMKKSWPICALTVVVLIVLETYLKAVSSPLVELFYINTLTKLILSVLFIYALAQLDATLPNKFHSVVGSLADLSFGIYFLHGYFILIYAIGVKHLGFTQLTAANPITFLVVFSTVMLCTIALLLAIQKLLGKNSRYVIGC